MSWFLCDLVVIVIVIVVVVEIGVRRMKPSSFHLALVMLIFVYDALEKILAFRLGEGSEIERF